MLISWVELQPLLSIQLSTIELTGNYFDESFWELFGKKSQNSMITAAYFLVYFLLYDSKLIIFGLWTKQDIWGRDILVFEKHFFEEKSQNSLIPAS